MESVKCLDLSDQDSKDIQFTIILDIFDFCLRKDYLTIKIGALLICVFQEEL